MYCQFICSIVFCVLLQIVVDVVARSVLRYIIFQIDVTKIYFWFQKKMFQFSNTLLKSPRQNPYENRSDLFLDRKSIFHYSSKLSPSPFQLRSNRTQPNCDKDPSLGICSNPFACAYQFIFISHRVHGHPPMWTPPGGSGLVLCGEVLN